MSPAGVGDVQAEGGGEFAVCGGLEAAPGQVSFPAEGSPGHRDRQDSRPPAGDLQVQEETGG